MSDSFFHQAREMVEAIREKNEPRLRELSSAHIKQSLAAIIGML